MASIAKHIPVNSGTAKAWSNLNGESTISERDSFGISSYTDNGTGDYSFNLAADMSDGNYAPVGFAGRWATETMSSSLNNAPAAGSFIVETGNTTNTPADCIWITAHVMGDLA